MTLELATKGIVYPKCQFLGVEAGAMLYPRDQVSGIATKGIVPTRCLLVTKEEIAIATRDAILSDATKFAGANIDAKISSRANPGDVKCGGGGGGGTIIERSDIWKPEEKLKLIEDIKKIYKMINELSSLQSVGLQNVKKNIESLKTSLLNLIKEEVALLKSLKKIVSEQAGSKVFEAKIIELETRWDSISADILKSSDFASLDQKLDELAKIVVKILPSKALEELVNSNERD